MAKNRMSRSLFLEKKSMKRTFSSSTCATTRASTSSVPAPCSAPTVRLISEPSQPPTSRHPDARSSRLLPQWRRSCDEQHLPLPASLQWRSLREVREMMKKKMIHEIMAGSVVRTAVRSSAITVCARTAGPARSARFVS